MWPIGTLWSFAAGGQRGRNWIFRPWITLLFGSSGSGLEEFLQEDELQVSLPLLTGSGSKGWAD